jgi:lysine 2,3-aminomutase
VVHPAARPEKPSPDSAEVERTAGPDPSSPTQDEWGDWHWQLRHRVRTAAELASRLQLTAAERADAEAVERAGFPICVTPYVLSLCNQRDPACPIRRQVVPHGLELSAFPGDRDDPLGEQAHELAPGLIRRYPDRALLLATDQCAVHCRFCTRRRLVGRCRQLGSRVWWERALDRLRCHPDVRDVIVSGGDPLLLGTRRLVRLVAGLRTVSSVETIRLATRVPTTLPQRITEELLAALRPYHPLWVMTHFNHPLELTAAARRGCRRLAEGGFPLLNQTVLLRGVNDDADVLRELFRALVAERVHPYYLHQTDPAAGTGHLRTPIATGLRIMAELQGRLSGIALPKLIVDTPGGHGKVPIQPEYICRREDGVTWLKTPWGEEVAYEDPPSSSHGGG